MPKPKFELMFYCDNDAFAGDPKREVVRILRDLAQTIKVDDSMVDIWNLYDINGNLVGRAVLEGFDDDGENT